MKSTFLPSGKALTDSSEWLTTMHMYLWGSGLEEVIQRLTVHPGGPGNTPTKQREAVVLETDIEPGAVRSRGEKEDEGLGREMEALQAEQRSLSSESVVDLCLTLGKSIPASHHLEPGLGRARKRPSFSVTDSCA